MAQEDLLIEVQEQMGKDRLDKFFKNYGNFLGYAALAIVVFVGGYEAWKSYDTGNRQEMGDKFFAAVDAQDKKIKSSQFAAYAGYNQLALMAKASQLAKAGNVDKAVGTYKKIWNSDGYDAAIRKIAKIKAAILLLNGTGESSAETPSWLNSSNDKIFEAEFNELVALHAMKNSNHKKAEKEFKEISANENTPITIKNRADAYLAELEK